MNFIILISKNLAHSLEFSGTHPVKTSGQDNLDFGHIMKLLRAATKLAYTGVGQVQFIINHIVQRRGLTK